MVERLELAGAAPLLPNVSSTSSVARSITWMCELPWSAEYMNRCSGSGENARPATVDELSSPRLTKPCVL